MMLSPTRTHLESSIFIRRPNACGSGTSRREIVAHAADWLRLRARLLLRQGFEPAACWCACPGNPAEAMPLDLLRCGCARSGSVPGGWRFAILQGRLRDQ